MEIDTSIRTANQESLAMQYRLKLISICLPSLSLTHSEWWTYCKWKCMIAESSLVINILEVKNMSWGPTICYSIWHYLIWTRTWVLVLLSSKLSVSSSHHFSNDFWRNRLMLSQTSTSPLLKILPQNKKNKVPSFPSSSSSNIYNQGSQKLSIHWNSQFKSERECEWIFSLTLWKLP